VANDPKKQSGPNSPSKDDDQKSLNADDLDVQELDEKLLENVAGGTSDLDPCGTYSPTNIVC